MDQKLWKEFGLKHEKKHSKLLKDKYKKNISINQDLDEKERNKKTIEISCINNQCCGF